MVSVILDYCWVVFAFWLTIQLSRINKLPIIEKKKLTNERHILVSNQFENEFLNQL